MKWKLPILCVFTSFLCRFGINAQGFRPPAIIGLPSPGNSGISTAGKSDRTVANNAHQEETLGPLDIKPPDFMNILQDPILRVLDPGPVTGLNVPEQIDGNPVRLLAPVNIDTPIPKAPPVIAPATNVVFDGTSSIASTLTAETGVQPPGPHIDFPNEHNNPNQFPIMHIPQSVQSPADILGGISHQQTSNFGTLFANTLGQRSGPITHDGAHVDPVGVHGNEGPVPVLHRPSTNAQEGVHVDPIGVHGNEGPGPVIHRLGPSPLESVHVDPVGVHGNEGPSPVLHRSGPHTQGGVHIDLVGVHGNEGPGPVIHRPGPNLMGGVHVDPVGVHGNEGPGVILHRPSETVQGEIHVDPVGIHGNVGPGPVLHRPGSTINGDIHVDPVGVHGNIGPGSILHRPGSNLDGGIHVDPVGVHGNEGPGPVVHRPGSNLDGGIHVDPVGVHGNEGPGPVVHRPGSNLDGGIHVDPVGVHGNEGPGPIVHRPGSNLDGGIHVDPVGVHGNEGPGPVVHRPGSNLDGGIHVDPVGVHGNIGPDPIIHRLGSNLDGGSHVDPVGVHGNIGPDPILHRPRQNLEGGVHVDPVGVHGNEGSVPILHRHGPSLHEGISLDSFGMHGGPDTGPMLHRADHSLHEGIHIGPVGMHDNLGPGLHRPGPSLQTGSHVNDVGLHGNGGFGQMLHGPDPLLVGGSHVNDVGVHDHLDRPIVQMPLGFDTHGKYIDRSQREGLSKPLKPFASPEGIFGKPKIFPAKATGFVDSSTHFVDVPLTPQLTKTKQIDKLGGVVPLQKGDHVDFPGQHNNPFNEPVIHTKDGRHITLDPAAKDLVGLHDPTNPVDKLSVPVKPTVDPFKPPVVVLPKRRPVDIMYRRRLLGKLRRRKNRRGKGKWKPKTKPAIKTQTVSDIIDRAKAEQVYQGSHHSAIKPTLGYPARLKPDIVPGKSIDIKKEPVKKKPKKKKTIRIIRIQPRNVHPLSALQNAARRGISAIVGNLLRGMHG